MRMPAVILHKKSVYPDAAASLAALSSDITLAWKEPRLILTPLPETFKGGLATHKNDPALLAAALETATSILGAPKQQ